MVLFEWINELMAPCLEPCMDGACCDDRGKHHRAPVALRTMRTPGHEVELAVSPLAGMRGFAGFHTSILVGGEEYYFCPTGICCSPNLVSHQDKAQLKRIYIGLSQESGSELLKFLSGYFTPGSYDLLRKNCNSFSDCALYFLCEQRLDLCYRTMEKFAWAADDTTGLLQSVTNGEYQPNPKAADFSVEAIIDEMDNARDSCSDDEVTPQAAAWQSNQQQVILPKAEPHVATPLRNTLVPRTETYATAQHGGPITLPTSEPHHQVMYGNRGQVLAPGSDIAVQVRVR
eukprot:TRINITY_DN2797_c0_g1_i1.p1 TRINITY_DN2797_c0_g1~~TRINITY_DN2797_c0_g1_i1.p1  ORF type:complete len:287 (+),score=44.13 TRINITY_DN2797_c0_g1_i1:62-922(+)